MVLFGWDQMHFMQFILLFPQDWKTLARFQNYEKESTSVFNAKAFMKEMQSFD